MNRNSVQIRFGGPITPYVKRIMIINGIVFLLQLVLGLFSPGILEYYFGLHYAGIFQEFKIWQILTYMFLHGSWFHIIFNLIGLWMFAGELEELWGGKLFIQYYLFSGIGAGVFITIMNYYIYSHYHVSPVTIGASGAIYGILLAYGLTWPNRIVLLYFAIPIKIKFIVIGFGLIEFFGTLSTAVGRGSNISHIGHIGGIISGLAFIFFKLRLHIKGYSNAYQRITNNPIASALQKKRVLKKKNEIDMRIKAKELIDILLEKIAREGMSSLTKDEKKQLDWARNRYYPEDKETIH